MLIVVVVVIVAATVLPILLRVAANSVIDRFIVWLGTWLLPPGPANQ